MLRNCQFVRWIKRHDKRTAGTPQEGVRTSREPRRRQKMGLDLEDLEGTARTPEEEYEEQIICVSEA